MNCIAQDLKLNMHRQFSKCLPAAAAAIGLLAAAGLHAADETAGANPTSKPPVFGFAPGTTNPPDFFQAAPATNAPRPFFPLNAGPGQPAPDAPAVMPAAADPEPPAGPAALKPAKSLRDGSDDTAGRPTAAPVAATPFPGFVPIPAAADAPPAAAASDEEEDDWEADMVTTNADETLVRLKYENWDVDEVLKQYSEWTGRALMKAPDVPAAKITLKCPRRIPRREALLAIEGILGMHGIALVPLGDKFLKVVPIGVARQSGMSTMTGPLDEKVSDTGHLVSRIMELKHLEIAEAQGTLQNLVSPNGKIIPLERINCLLITDAAVNLKRIAEVLELIDLPMGSREEFRIFQINYAKASEIQSKIEAIIADTQTTDNRASLLRQQLLAARMPLRRPGQPPTPAAASTSTAGSMDRSLIQGKVKIVADDRTNILIIITRPDQFDFFDNIISALDKQVEPDVSIKVIRLEYADSEKVVDVLNSLVGASKSSSTAKTPADKKQDDSRTRPLPPSFPQPAQTQPAAARETSGEITIEGRLSDDVKIIADPRINALLIMASKTDMAVIEDVLSKVDIMLSQVLIEVVIIEVNLDDNTRMGVDWLQRSMIAYNEKQSGERRAFLGFSGASRVGTQGALRNAANINTIGDSPAGDLSGLTYYFTLFDFNIDAVLNMLATSSDARILSTPIILTTDNTEAKILVGEKRPIVTSTSLSSGGVQQSAYQYTDIGIDLNVTPRINKKGFVVMEIEQTIDNTGGDVTIDQNKVPIITTRELNASVAINDGRTIVLGGLVSTEESTGNSGIPFLRRIPLLGLLFRSDTDEKARRELLVMITPYVLDTPERALEETARRHAAMGDATNMWLKGWTASDLAKPDPDREENAPPRRRPELELPASAVPSNAGAPDAGTHPQ